MGFSNFIFVFSIFMHFLNIVFRWKMYLLQKKFKKSVGNFPNLEGFSPPFFVRTKIERKWNEKTNEKRTKSYDFYLNKIKYKYYITHIISKMPSIYAQDLGFKTSQRQLQKTFDTKTCLRIV